MVFVSCVLFTSNPAVDGENYPVILYTAPQEMNSFQHMQRSEHMSFTQFLKDTGSDSDDSKALVVLCGDDGKKCPQVSISQGSDDFEFKPMNEEQAAVWNKWLGLKDRVADLEDTLKNMMEKSSSRSMES